MKLSGLDSSHFKIESEQTISDGFLKLKRFELRHQLFNGGTSELLVREALVRQSSVGVLLFDPSKNCIALVEQFRVGPALDQEDPWILEIVAGLSEAGETIEQLAHREVFEESGYRVDELIPIGNIYVSPGGNNERIQLFCGLLDLDQQPNHNHEVYGLKEEHEDIKVHLFSVNEAYSMICDGRIANAAAVIAIQWLQLNKLRFHENHYKQT